MAQVGSEPFVAANLNRLGRDVAAAKGAIAVLKINGGIERGRSREALWQLLHVPNAVEREGAHLAVVRREAHNVGIALREAQAVG